MEFLVFAHQPLDGNDCVSRRLRIEQMQHAVAVYQIAREFPVYTVLRDANWPNVVADCQIVVMSFCRVEIQLPKVVSDFSGLNRDVPAQLVLVQAIKQGL